MLISIGLYVFFFIVFFISKTKITLTHSIKIKILRHGQNINTQKTEQNNTYQLRPPQGTQ